MQLPRITFTIFIALAATAGLYLLLTRPGPKTEGQTFEEVPASLQAPEPYSLASEKRTEFRISFDISKPVAPEGLEILLGTYDEPKVQVVEAELSNPDRSCLYESKRNSELKNNMHLHLAKMQCASFTGKVTFRVRFDHPISLAVWTYLVDDLNTAGKGGVRVLEDPPSIHKGKSRFAYGFYEVLTANPQQPRFELLNVLWGSVVSPHVFLIGILSLAISASVAFSLWVLRIQPTVTISLTWLFLSLLYTVLTPPFQAPDEPDHVLGYAEQFGDSDLSATLLALAQKGHFEKIKFRGHHKFTSTDALTPELNGWAEHISAVEMRARSPVTSGLWQVHRFFFGRHNAAITLLSLRTFNALITSLALFCGLLFLKEDYFLQGSFAFLLFLTPALPSFAMHISNYFTTLSIAIIQVCSFARVLKNRPLSWAQLVTLSLVVGLTPFSSAVNIGSVLLWAIFLPWIVGDKRPLGKASKPNTCVLLRAAAMTCGPVLCLLLYRSNELFSLPSIASLLTIFSKTRFGHHKQETYALLGLLIWTAVIASLTLARSKSGWLRVISSFIQTLMKPFETFFPAMIIAAIVIANIAIWFGVSYPLPEVETTSNLVIKPWLYARAALKTSLFSFTPFPVDFLFSSSYWVGFGWLESLPKPIFTGFLRMIMATGVAAWFFELMRSKDRAKARKTLAFFLGLELFVAGLAVGAALQGQVNLHGRYLISYYMGLNIIAAFGWAAFAEHLPIKHVPWARGWQTSRIIASVSFCLIISVHSYFISFILNRYF